MIKWTTHKETQEIEANIARRAVAMAKEHGIQYDQMTAVMDIDACHKNGNPLKLGELLEADDFNFAHDVFGIRQHINRTNGKLSHCFVPSPSPVHFKPNVLEHLHLLQVIVFCFFILISYSLNVVSLLS